MNARSDFDKHTLSRTVVGKRIIRCTNISFIALTWERSSHIGEEDTKGGQHEEEMVKQCGIRSKVLRQKQVQ